MSVRPGTPKENKDLIGSASVDYLMYSGYMHLGYHWLMAERASVKALKNPKLDDAQKEFHKAKIQTADFYFSRMFPRIKTIEATMLQPPSKVMQMKEENFAFDL